MLGSLAETKHGKRTQQVDVPTDCVDEASSKLEIPTNRDVDAELENESDGERHHVAFDEQRKLSSTRATLVLAIQAARRDAIVPSISQQDTPGASLPSSPKSRRKSKSPFHLWREKKAQRQAAKILLETPIQAMQSITPRKCRAAAALEIPEHHEEPHSQQPHEISDSTEQQGQRQATDKAGVSVDKGRFTFNIKQLAIARNMGIFVEAIGGVLEEFNRLDVNGDGRMSKDEFVSVVSRLGEFTDEYVNRMWEVADADNNGQIDWSEFLHWYKYHCWTTGLFRPD